MSADLCKVLCEQLKAIDAGKLRAIADTLIEANNDALQARGATEAPGVVNQAGESQARVVDLDADASHELLSVLPEDADEPPTKKARTDMKGNQRANNEIDRDP